MSKRRIKRPFLLGFGALAGVAALVLGGGVAANSRLRIAEDQRDASELSLRNPEDAAASTLCLSTVQICEASEAGWVQIPEDNQDAHDIEAPAPAVDVVAASEAGSQGDGDSSDTTIDARGDEDTSSGAADQTALLAISLAVGSLGLILAVIAMFRGRKRA